MNNHIPKIVGNDGAWQAKCTCRMRSPVYEQRWEADDWNRTHMQAVDRARAHLRDRAPSLKDQRDWYRKQAARATDETIRKQWLVLADGLDHRLGTGPHDESLF